MDRAPDSRIRVGIVGAGRAGLALGRALQAAGGVDVIAAHARSEPNRERIRSAFGIEPADAIDDVMLAGADVLLLGVPDDPIARVAAELGAIDAPATTVVLLSGSASFDQLAPLAKRGHAIARLQPLHPCTPDTTPDQLAGSFATIGGLTPAAIARSRELAARIGLSPILVPEESLAVWHAAATMAANHLTAQLATARDVALGAGVDPEVALDALASLASSAVRAVAASSPEQALTGPVARGDAATVARHRRAVAAAAPGQLDAWRRGSLASLELAGEDRRVARAITGLEIDDITRVTSVAELRAALAGARDGGLRVGFVPTMGALHDGHAELVRRARAECDVVVVSCFVNPTQFGPSEDLNRYPRTPEADERIVADAGGDVLWRPSVEDIYGADPDAGTFVRVGALGDVLEGASRPGHFDGVASVVVRLLGAVRPHALYLGAKDFQQVAVLRRVLEDLAIDVDLRVVPIVRDEEGIARSSRNAYLDPAERRAALAIPASLDVAATIAAAGERSTRAIRQAVIERLERDGGVDVDYVEVRDAVTLAARDVLGGSPVVVLVAARVGGTRLIDNVVLDQRRPQSVGAVDVVAPPRTAQSGLPGTRTTMR